MATTYDNGSATSTALINLTKAETAVTTYKNNTWTVANTANDAAIVAKDLALNNLTKAETAMTTYKSNTWTVANTANDAAIVAKDLTLINLTKAETAVTTYRGVDVAEADVTKFTLLLKNETDKVTDAADAWKIILENTPGGATNQTILDSFILQGFDGSLSTWNESGNGSLFGLTSFIRCMAIEPYAFPLIIKLPSGEFLFLFVRNWDNNTTDAPVPTPIFDINSLLTVAQQKGIASNEPISSYIAALNEHGLKVLSYLSIKTCKKPDGTFYYVPTKMYAMDRISLASLGNSKVAINNTRNLIFALKNAYIIAMFAIALKLLGSITLPRMNRASPHPFDSQLTAAIRTIFNKNYISAYDSKNTASRADPANNKFVEHTFFSSHYWGINKTTSEAAGANAATAFIDSYPDLLGLGDISSTSPSNNEIPFIDVSQWDITEGMTIANAGKAYNFKGSAGLIKFSDYTQSVQSFRANGNSAPRPRLVPDVDSGILVSDGSITNKGFISLTSYELCDSETLFRSLRNACYKHVTPAQQGNFANSKYVIKQAKKVV